MTQRAPEEPTFRRGFSLSLLVHLALLAGVWGLARPSPPRLVPQELHVRLTPLGGGGGAPDSRTIGPAGGGPGPGEVDRPLREEPRLPEPKPAQERAPEPEPRPEPEEELPEPQVEPEPKEELPEPEPEQKTEEKPPVKPAPEQEPVPEKTPPVQVPASDAEPAKTPPADAKPPDEEPAPRRGTDLPAPRTRSVEEKSAAKKPAAKTTPSPETPGTTGAPGGSAQPGGHPGARGQGAGPGGPGSGGMVLDSPFPYPWYLEIIRRRVSANWLKPAAAAGLEQGTIVYFRVLRNGELGLVEVERSSGLELFDRSALRAVHSMGRLPPLPKGFREDYLGVHFEFIP